MSDGGEVMDTTTTRHPGERDRTTQPKLAEIGAVPVPEPEQEELVFELEDVAVSYGPVVAVEGVSLGIGRNRITALIGPSGCGKTTVLRCLNRMNDLIDIAKVEGSVRYHGVD